MLDYTDLSVGGKDVKWMTFNKRIVYSADENQTSAVLATENAALQTAGYDSSTGTYTPPGDSSAYTYYTCPTTAVGFVEAGDGLSHLFPIAPHVWCRAKHYNSALTSFTFGGSTYNVTEQIGLTVWARQNNLSVPFENIDDIEVLTTTQAVDSSKVPYLMSWMQFQGTFHRDALKGMFGYVVPQTTNKPQPVVFTNDIASGETTGELQWSTPALLSSLVPDDCAYMKSMNPTYLGTTGDSGRPVFIYVDRKPVIVSHNHQVFKPTFGPTAPYYMTGPNYIKAFPLLKAYAESKGDEVKVWSKDISQPTMVKYTAASGLPDWEGDIVGELTNSSIPNKSDIEEVELGSHVTSIGANAFGDCTSLTNVTIGNNVTSIGY